MEIQKIVCLLRKTAPAVMSTMRTNRLICFNKQRKHTSEKESRISENKKDSVIVTKVSSFYHENKTSHISDNAGPAVVSIAGANAWK